MIKRDPTLFLDPKDPEYRKAWQARQTAFLCVICAVPVSNRGGSVFRDGGKLMTEQRCTNSRCAHCCGRYCQHPTS